MARDLQYSIGILPLLTFVIACGKIDAQGLPPAKGEGVEPAPALPQGSKVAVTEASEAVQSDTQTTGTTHAIRRAELSAKVSGPLVEVMFEEGDHVKKDQVVFRVDGGNTYLRVKQAQLAIETADFNLSSARRDLERNEKLARSGSISSAAFEVFQDKVDDATLQKSRAQLELRTAQQAASETVTRSPISGVVTTKERSVGESVSKDSTVVLIVEDISTIEVRARVAERSLAGLSVGAPMKIQIPGEKEEREVKVARISPAVDAQSRTAEVVAVLPNEDGRLKSGMLVRVSLSADAVETK